MPGLIVTARQTYYPIELSNSELLSHFNTIREYNDDITRDSLRQCKKFRPDNKLIDQQPEMIPQLTRQSMVTFLYKLSIMSKVTNGIFYHAVRLYDRYCSKRIILRDQAKLVISTCLWLAAKTYGGCNHIINNYVIPTGGRFYGPNPRARIPRLSELVHYCNNKNNEDGMQYSGGKFDESMFCQMELHILDTLNWNVYEPSINDFVLNVDENCLIQYELYQNQLQNNNNNNNNSNNTNNNSDSSDTGSKRDSQNSTDTDATVDDINDLLDEDKELVLKIQLINLKRFLIDLSCWQYDLLKYDTREIVLAIFHMINTFSDHDVSPFLSISDDLQPHSLNPTTPEVTIHQTTKSNEIQNVFINALINVPQSLLLIYKEQSGIVPFVFKVKEYYSNLQMMNALDIQRRKINNAQYFDSYNNNNMDVSSSIESSPSISVTTPSRQQYSINSNNTNGSINSAPGNKSDNSIFSNHHYPYANVSASYSQISPITPQMYAFSKDAQGQPIPNNGSNITINSISNDKENISMSQGKIHPIINRPNRDSMLRPTTESQQNAMNNNI